MAPHSQPTGKKKVKGPEIPKDETLEETEARLQTSDMKLCIFQVRHKRGLGALNPVADHACGDARLGCPRRPLLCLARAYASWCQLSMPSG